MSRRRELLFSVAAGLALIGWAGSQFFGRDSNEAAASTDFRTLRNFDRITARGPDRVIVTPGNDFSVRTSDNASLKMTVENGELRIGRREQDRQWRNFRFWGFGGNGRSATIHVTLPAIRAASQFGSGDMRIDHVTGDGLDVRLAGSGDIRVNDARVGRIRAWLAGSGDLSLSGSADNATLSLAGSGDIRAAGMKVGTADVSVAGSGDVKIASDGKASVSMLGSGDVRVLGSAQCSISRRGSGDIECG